MTDPTVSMLELPTDDTPVSPAALMYVRAGFAPVPVHGVRGERCACSDARCAAVGKHPVGDGWQRRVAVDVDVARSLFAEHTGNIGLVLGETFVCLDVDYYAGGREGLAELAAEVGELPATLTSESGSGQGEHRIYAYSPGQDPREVSNRKVAAGVDVKTRSGQIVVAPSRHRSGGVYRWVDRSPPALLPDALYERLRKRPVAQVVPIRPAARVAPGDLLLRRAEAYLAKVPGAVAGQRGHDATFAVARQLWGWVAKGVPQADAWALFLGFNARCDPPWSERELEHKWADAERADRIPVYEDRPSPDTPPSGGPAPPAPPAADDAWRGFLVWAKQRSGPDKLAKHHENAVVVLRYHPAWRGRIQFDEHAQRVLVTSPPWDPSDAPSRSLPTAEWTDADSVRLSAWLRRNVYALALSVADCDRAVTVAAEANACHPFREYLEGLTWDGTERLAHWLADYLGTAQTEYTALVGAWWLTSAVARTFTPGEKADNVLILEGDQGIKKSTALRVLAGARWFSDTPIDIGSKDAYLALQGRVIVELAELDSLRRADADRAKTFFSSAVDQYRPPYGKRTVTVPRGCVFAGTVNPKGGYLRDSTGNRRFWPIQCSEVDIAGLASVRDQLWAEAVARYRAGGLWYADTPGERALCVAEQEPRAEGDAWENLLARYLHGRDETTQEAVLQEALAIDKGRIDRAAQMRVASILKAHGFERRQFREGSIRYWVYRRVGVGAGLTAGDDK